MGKFLIHLFMCVYLHFICFLMFCAKVARLLCDSMLLVVSFCICLLVNVMQIKMVIIQAGFTPL